MPKKKVLADWYLTRYPDVASSGLSAEEHYEKLGRAAGRFPYPPTLFDYPIVYSRRLRYLVTAWVRYLRLRFWPDKKVDEVWYLTNYPDVAASGLSAQEHYVYFGKAEGRRTGPPSQVSRAFLRTKMLRNAIRFMVQQNGYFGALKKLYACFRREGYVGLKHLIVRTLNNIGERDTANDYADWITRNELGPDDVTLAREKLARLPLQPRISIVMPTYNSSLEWLNEAIESVRVQPYENWELCIADDASPRDDIRPFLEAWAQRDARIKVVVREKNGHISEASNTALTIATGEWIALFDHDDLFHPFALYWVLKALNQNPDAQLIYSDEDKIDESGVRSDPYFKPNWNYDLFLSQNCFSHLGLIKKELADSIGGFRKGLEGSQDHDLILRAIEKISENQIVHIPKVLYHWRVHADSTAKSADSKPYAAVAGERAIGEHLVRQGISASVSFEGYGYRVKYPLPSPLPLVSLIIPTRNGLHLLRQCIDSIVSKTIYNNYEFIIVDNGSDDELTLDYLAALKSRQNFQVIRDDRPFNYSQLNNLAAQNAKGEIIGLINNDIEVIAPEWLSEMVSHVVRPEIGAVGAKLLFPDDTLQHGGVILGVGGVANHAHLYKPKSHNGYFSRMSVIQQYSAVTAACLLVRKAVYYEVGGLNEKNLTVAFNDVDFCIRITKLGYKNLWTPYAELYHHESATRGQDVAPEKRARFVGEVNYMRTTWSKDLRDDPAYNPNLNIEVPDFSLSKTMRLGKWSLDMRLQECSEK